MRKNGYSRAFREFNANLGRARHLRILEKKHFKDPPASADQGAVEALRGGAVVLLVATLETYIVDAIEEHVEVIGLKAGKTTHASLAAKFVQHNDFSFINWIVRDARQSKTERVLELKRVARLIANDGFVLESFSRIRANPGPEAIKELIREFGVTDALKVVEGNFRRHYKKPFSAGFMEATLSNIISRRNEVAHEGYSLTITRTDLGNWIGFVAAFVKATDNTLRDHTRGILSRL